MEMETPHQAGVDSAADQGGKPANTDGIAAQVANELGIASPGGATVAQPATEPRKRGRPATHGLYSKAAGSNGKKPVRPVTAAATGETDAGSAPAESLDQSQGQAVPPTRRVVVPPNLVTKIVKTGLTCGENFATRKIRTAAKGAGLTDGEISPQIEQAELGDESKELVAELTPLAMEEWGIDPEMSPTAAIGFILGPWVFGAVTSYMTLARLAEEKAERDKSREAAAEN